MNSDSRRRFRLLIPVAVIAFVGVLSYAVYALWNGVLTDVLGVKTITYWQALGLLVLSKILFGGFPGGRGRFGRCGCGPDWARQAESLPPEQRERLREEMRQRFGDWPRPTWCKPAHPDSEGPGKPAGT